MKKGVLKKRVLGLFIAASIVCSMMVGCANTPAETKQNENASTQDTKGNSYSIAANTFGVGAYPLDAIITSDRFVSDFTGMNLDVANNEFTVDKVISQLENQLANNPDAVLFLGIAETTFPAAVQAIQEKGKLYAFDTNIPEEATLSKCLEDELFCGVVTAAQYDLGADIAKKALSDGCKSAVITAAAVGDYSHDNRIIGFTDVFEAGGGEVIQVAHSADPSEAVQKTNDLLTAVPDADCIYATGGDYLIACVSVKESRSDINSKVYGTDIDPSAIEYIRDGIVDAMNGGQSVAGSLTLTLLINALDGHKILNKDGSIPILNNLSVFTITKDNAAAFEAFYKSGKHLIAEDYYKNLLYRYNPDVTIDTYNEFLENYGNMVCEMVQ